MTVLLRTLAKSVRVDGLLARAAAATPRDGG
ncbi:hypothetical protein F4556_000657 [Kitasatospora gansuensis]|uniref:Uncharacterized protein n=1 Tax=Kitasatospora gansuensis TaxID=258050 RepID=A0A7W7S7I9_9ACTN|nr:hypothetical protein [Kitasatospora gansuensis]